MNLSKIKTEIKNEWKQYKLQIIGLILLNVAIPLGFLQEWGIGFALLAGILGLDLWLILSKQDTITKWTRRQLPGWADKLIMLGLFVFVAKFGGWGYAYWFTLGTILGHLKWSN